MPAASDWPTLSGDARIGIVGELLDLVEGNTEADPVGIVVSFLAAFGNLVGDGPILTVDKTLHRPVLNVIKIGSTSKARKGTAQNVVNWIIRRADPAFGDRIRGGYQSGEGIAKDLTPREDPGPYDRHILWVEGEFARIVSTAGRQGNNLSTTIRTLWDGDPLHNRLGGESRGSDHHVVSVIADVTEAELAAVLTETDVLNGFANRFLWVRVRRSGVFPDGGPLRDDAYDHLADQVAAAAKAVDGVKLMRRDDQAKAVWDAWYRAVADVVRPGLYGAVTAREEANTLRLSMVYALLAGQATIEARHVKAAIAVWDYCAVSAQALFGKRTGDRDVDKLVGLLDEAATEGIDGGRLDDHFKGRSTQVRDRAVAAGVAVDVAYPTGGRPRRVLYAPRHAPATGTAPKRTDAPGRTP